MELASGGHHIIIIQQARVYNSSVTQESLGHKHQALDCSDIRQQGLHKAQIEMQTYLLGLLGL